MIVVWVLSWWYGSGWKACILGTRERLARTYDYFSIDLLARTLFSPFRQISAGKVSGSLETRWRAFVDRLLSRAIGGMIRSTLIVIGSVWLLVQSLIGVVTIVAWIFVPILPLMGFIAMVAGWVPTWR